MVHWVKLHQQKEIIARRRRRSPLIPFPRHCCVNTEVSYMSKRGSVLTFVYSSGMTSSAGLHLPQLDPCQEVCDLLSLLTASATVLSSPWAQMASSWAASSLVRTTFTLVTPCFSLSFLCSDAGRYVEVLLPLQVCVGCFVFRNQFRGTSRSKLSRRLDLFEGFCDILASWNKQGKGKKFPMQKESKREMMVDKFEAKYIYGKQSL